MVSKREIDATACALVDFITSGERYTEIDGDTLLTDFGRFKPREMAKDALEAAEKVRAEATTKREEKLRGLIQEIREDSIKRGIRVANIANGILYKIEQALHQTEDDKP